MVATIEHDIINGFDQNDTLAHNTAETTSFDMWDLHSA